MNADDDLLQRAGPLSTCQISDGLAACGLPPDGLDGLYPISGAAKIAGPAFTVTFRPHALAADAIDYIDLIPKGAVVVLANEGRLDCSVWGGQRSIGALRRGAVGSIVDGAYRDVEEHQQLRFPVYGRAPTIVGSRGVVVPVAIGEDAVLAGRKVSTGDLIVADRSGVVTVPIGQARKVLDAATRIAEEEEDIAAAVS
jgi:regulator of RNase E activity RraA